MIYRALPWHPIIYNGPPCEMMTYHGVIITAYAPMNIMAHVRPTHDPIDMPTTPSKNSNLYDPWVCVFGLGPDVYGHLGPPHVLQCLEMFIGMGFSKERMLKGVKYVYLDTNHVFLHVFRLSGSKTCIRHCIFQDLSLIAMSYRVVMEFKKEKES